MSTLTPSSLHSRETLAGYNRETLERAVVVLVGAGAAGNNLALHLAAAGIGELRIVDPDHIEESNLSRSPLFRREAVVGRQRAKAKELALGWLARSYASAPVARYANAAAESLGAGLLEDAHVVIAAVDRFDTRAYLADLTRLLGVPLVEVGFRYPEGHVSVFPNAAAEEPCFRCLYPDLPRGGVSCTLYARQAVEAGATPNTQSIAALATAYLAEAVIQALHGSFPLGGAQLAFDVRSGATRRTEITHDDACPGAHRRYEQITSIDVGAREPIGRVMEVVAASTNAVVRLPSAFVLHAPCARCGAPVPVGRPSHALTTAPVCASCPDLPQLGARRLEVVRDIAAGDAHAQRLLRNVGVAPRDVIEVWDGAVCRAVRLSGELSELLHTRAVRNGREADSMVQTSE